MSFNFPDAPTVGQIYEPVLGVSYVWVPPVWRRQVSPSEGMDEAPVDGLTYGRKNEAWSPVVGGALISDIPPPPPLQAGQLWYEGDSGVTFIYYDDGNSVQWVQIAGPQSGQQTGYVRSDIPQTMAGPLTITQGPVTVAGQPLGPTAQTRNRIVNGAMQISQENGNSASTLLAYYAADQWNTYFVSSGTFLSQRATSTTPNGSIYRYRVTVNVADAALAAGDRLDVYQSIEGTRIADFGWGTAAAKQAVLRFGFRGPAGTYCASLRNAAVNRSYLMPFTISAGQANTDTMQTFVIPGDTIGTWPVDTSAALLLDFAFAAGTTFQGTATTWQAGNLLATSTISNGMATAGNVFELFDVGLYLDPQNTGLPPRWEMPDEAQELRICERYYQQVVLGAQGYQPGAGADQSTPINFRTPMRVTPAATNVSPGSVGSATVSNEAATNNLGGYFQIRATAAATVFVVNRVTAYSARM
jgi:hypothetical protein